MVDISDKLIGPIKDPSGVFIRTTIRLLHANNFARGSVGFHIPGIRVKGINFLFDGHVNIMYTITLVPTKTDTNIVKDIMWGTDINTDIKESITTEPKSFYLVGNLNPELDHLYNSNMFPALCKLLANILADQVCALVKPEYLTDG